MPNIATEIPKTSVSLKLSCLVHPLFILVFSYGTGPVHWITAHTLTNAETVHIAITAVGTL